MHDPADLENELAAKHGTPITPAMLHWLIFFAAFTGTIAANILTLAALLYVR